MTKSTQPAWQTSLSNVVTDPAELCQLLELPPHALNNAGFAHQDFALRVPREFVARMQKGNLDDPLLKQILPVADEMQAMPGYSNDPLQEKQANPLPGLLHKYQGRVLLLVAGGCAVHCRYCFRRHFSYAENVPGKPGWEAILNYIAADSSIREVIYSGGDPLLLKDEVLAVLTQKLAAIPHVTTLRIHTRLPVVIPARITDALLSWLTGTRLQPVMVIHSNHAHEMDAGVIAELERLRRAHITVLNQTVLLKGINDDADTLIKLSQRLFSGGVLPYYLHMLDAVQGAAHFTVSTDTARQLVATMADHLPGYLVPKLVREVPGMKAKCPI